MIISINAISTLNSISLLFKHFNHARSGEETKVRLVQDSRIRIFPGSMNYKLPDRRKASDIWNRCYDDPSWCQEISRIVQRPFGGYHVFEHVIEENTVKDPNR